MSNQQISPEHEATPAPDPDRWFAQEELSGSKVRLVPLTIEHAAGYLAALHADNGADEVFRYLGKGDPPRTLEESRRAVLAALVGRARGERFGYAQLDAGTGAMIGTTSLYDVVPAARTLAIGHTWLGTPWWRTGHNADAKLLLLTYAFETLGAARVVWHTDARNQRSRAAIAGLGATQEGVLRKHRIRADGTWRDTAQFAMIDDDWPVARQQLEDRMSRH